METDAGNVLRSLAVYGRDLFTVSINIVTFGLTH